MTAFGDDLEQNIKALALGGVRKQLGLEQEDLKPGLVMAKGLMDAGRWDKALEVFLGLILLDPADVDVQLGLSNCALQLQQYSLAIEAASAAMVLSPSNPRSYYYSGAACLALGHIAEAREDLEETVRLCTTREFAELAVYAKKLLDGLNIAR